jgi:hypothetical protein
MGKAKRTPKTELNWREKTIRHYQKLLREGSLSKILDHGLSSGGDFLVCLLSRDRKMDSILERFDEAHERIRELCFTRQDIPADELKQRIWHEANKLNDLNIQTSIHAAELMFDTLVGFFLQQLPFPFAKLIGSRAAGRSEPVLK